jgi:hypothetical protein
MPTTRYIKTQHRNRGLNLAVVSHMFVHVTKLLLHPELPLVVYAIQSLK